MLYNYLRILVFSALSVFSSSAQQSPSLPKGFTAEEKALLPNITFTNSLLTAAPIGPVRTAAEWEEVQYLVVTWDANYQNILRQIVQVGITECHVIITTQNQQAVASYLTSNGISLNNITFMNAPWNSIWIRDYGGNTIYSNDVGERGMVDWIYNRPRPLDNVMPTAHATLTGMPIYITNSGINDLVNTGGNFMSDGLGNAFASELVLSENAAGNPYNVTAKTEAQIDGIMQSYMGIDNYIKMPVLPYDGIHHIDMHMKLIDEETLLVSKYPTGVADGPQIEQNINYILNNHLSPFGTPYQIRWIDAPPSTSGSFPDTGGYYRTYSNCLIVNKSVLVPTYRPEVDAVALAYFEALMPGYNIVGIDVDNSPETLIAASGAIHCITHTIGVSEPLLIVHQAVRQANSGADIAIEAMIKHQSGINSASVFWRLAGSPNFNMTPMTSGIADNWTVNLQAGNSGTDIEYYIRANANSGKSLNRPLVAPDGYWTIAMQTLSVDQWAASNISGAFPNPAKEKVSFRLEQLEGPIQVTVTNLLGQQFFTQLLEDGNQVATFGLNFAYKGLLLFTFEGRFGTISRKVLRR